MTTSTIPCRAKNPATCPYHGAELRANKALAAGLLDDYLTAQQEMLDAAKASDEVTDFFAKQITDPAKPFATAADIQKVLVDEFPNQQRRYSLAIATEVQSVLLETGTTKNDRLRQFRKVRNILENNYGFEDVRPGEIPAGVRRVFQANGWVTTRAENHGLHIYDTRSARLVETTAKDLKRGDLLAKPDGTQGAEVVAFRDSNWNVTDTPTADTKEIIVDNSFTRAANEDPQGGIYPYAATDSYTSLEELV